jgi:hypothetical protein
MPESRRSIVPSRPPVLLEDPPEFIERGNLFIGTYCAGDYVFSVACTPHVFLAGLERAQAAYEQWAGENRQAQGIFRREYSGKD